jgi:IPT/TIG domain-containing protein
VLYFAVRGGLLPMGAEVGSVSLFGIAAISALAGMFSKQATDKLREVFDTFFKTAAGDQRADKLHNPLPSIAAIDPPSVPVGGAEVKITIKGSNFIEESVVRVNDSERPTDFASTTQLVAHLTPADTQTPGAYPLTVFNPPPGGGASSPAQLVVKAGA